MVLEAPGLPPPLEALGRLEPDARPFLRLSRGPGFRGRPFDLLLARPSAVLERRRVRAGEGAAALAPLRPRPATPVGPLPFASGWAGMLGYEARSLVERRPPSRPPPLGFPVLWFGRYEEGLAWDARAGRAYVAAAAPTRRAARARARALVAAWRGSRPFVPRPLRRHAPRPRLDPAEYLRRVRRVRALVRAGEIFQANLSQRLDAPAGGDPRALFARLAESQPAPYLTYLEPGPGRAVLSASPERFLRVRGGVVETDPMKGTRPRGATAGADRRLRADLEASEKDRAELAMIVDLSRNDLARVCRPGSVRVLVPRRLLRFARVHQAIAVVRGRLRPGQDRVDAILAAFPPGSVTGAPKVRAMEVIDALEGEGRGPYCGALGWLDDAGDADLCVAIRTLAATPRRVSYRVGGGITLRSDPRAEWRETLDKGRGLYAAVAGREDRS